MGKITKRILADLVSMNEIMRGIVTEEYEIHEIKNIRINCLSKREFTVLCVQSDISEDMANFILQDETLKANKDIQFEETVYDFVAVKLEGNTLMSMSLNELFLMNSLIERGAGDDDFGVTNKNNWDPTIQEWTMYEIIDEEKILTGEQAIQTDMRQFG